MGRATGGVSDVLGRWGHTWFANMVLAQALGELGYTGFGSRAKSGVQGYGCER